MNSLMTRRDVIACAATALAGIVSLGITKPHSAWCGESVQDNSNWINRRFLEIQAKYSVGDKLSPEDYEFVQAYAIANQDGIEAHSKNDTIYASRYYNGHTYELSGNCWLNGMGVYTWGGTLQTGSATTTSGTKTVYLGIVAFQGVNVIANQTVPRSGGAGSYWFTGEPFGSFSGAASSHYFTYYSTIATNDGNSITVS